jgi:hypothetical protein
MAVPLWRMSESRKGAHSACELLVLVVYRHLFHCDIKLFWHLRQGGLLTLIRLLQIRVSSCLLLWLFLLRKYLIFFILFALRHAVP